MELEPKDLGLTLTLGGLAIYGFWQIFRIMVVADHTGEKQQNDRV
jgi:hypothetical protein